MFILIALTSTSLSLCAIYFFALIGEWLPVSICLSILLFGAYLFRRKYPKWGCAVLFSPIVFFILPFELLNFVGQKQEIMSLNQLVRAGDDGITILNPGMSIRTAIALEYATLACARAYSTVTLENRGGDNMTANYIAKRLKHCGVTRSKVVGAKCASSCTGIFYAFSEREISDGGVLSFHRSTNQITKEQHTREIEGWYAGKMPRTLMRVIQETSGDEECVLDSTELSLINAYPYNDRRAEPDIALIRHLCSE